MQVVYARWVSTSPEKHKMFISLEDSRKDHLVVGTFYDIFDSYMVYNSLENYENYVAYENPLHQFIIYSTDFILVC